MNIFNIGKANARVAELETELASYKENAATVEKTAETMQSSLLAAQADLATQTSEVNRLTGLMASKDAEIAKLTAAQSDFDAKVAKEGAAKAVVIAAAVGVPAVKIATAEDPTKAENKPILKGLARTAAAIKIRN